MIGYIYRHFIVNDKHQEKSYIGQAHNQTLKHRWQNGNGYKPKEGKRPSKFYNAINKYGWDSFGHEIILTIECDTIEDLVFWLDEWEKYYIEKYDSFHNGYNSTTGGNGGKILSDEVRKKIGESQKGEKHHSYGKKGKPNAWCGKTHTEETKKKLSNIRKGKKASVETKKKMSDARKGEKHHYYGKKRDEETVRVVAEKHKKKVICLNTLEVFDSVKEAQERYNISNGVSKCCRGQGYKTVGKHPITGERLKWMYYEDYLKGEE